MLHWLAASAYAQLQIIAGPYLQAPSGTGITVMWATNHKCVSKVEYGTSPDGSTMTAERSQHGLVDANITLHCVPLTGLKPGTCYYYRVVSTEILDFQPYKVVFGDTVKSQDNRFTTLDANKDRFSFVVLNDRHEKTDLLAQALNSINWDGVDLVFFNGDAANHLTSEEQIFQSIIQPATKVFAGRIPLVFVRGNHETRGSFARMLMNYFPSATGRFYYSFSHGGVHFVILDSGEDKADSDPEYSMLTRFESYLEEETNWLKEEIRSKSFRKARLRVVLVHIPPWDITETKGKFIREKYLWDHWGPLFNEGRVDLLLSGHTHKYAEVPPAEDKNQYPILIGGTDTIIRVDAAAGHLSVTTFNNDGSLKSKWFDRLTISRKGSCGPSEVEGLPSIPPACGEREGKL
jgi:predicted phosphodiesterase